MIKIVLCLVGVIVLISCAKKTFTGTQLQKPYNVLLQESKGSPFYIFLSNDSAFHEFHRADKTSYFTDLDTLIRKDDCNCYQSKSRRLFIEENGNVNLKHASKSGKEKNISFKVATPEQIQTWNGYKNLVSYYSLRNSILRLIAENKISSDNNISREKDLERLYSLAKTLNQRDYNAEIASFKTRFSID